jgi:2-desacetyl-2-hydroxyethyl bacteriochlorophyllide A dehydrogenase
MRRLLITGPRKIDFEERPDDPLTPTSIRVKSLYSGISHGTEMNFYRGTAPSIANEIDEGLFRPRTGDHSPYPIPHGYEMVGEVIETGADVEDYRVGDIAWAGTDGHPDTFVCDTTVDGRPFYCERAPDGAYPANGLFLALSGVSYDGVLTSRLRLGESAVVSGLGVIGLFAVQLAKMAGVSPLIAVDPLPLRREKALEFGADAALDPTETSLGEKIRELNNGRGVEAVIETSGNWRALHSAIRCCASGYGRVVALGFYQGGGDALRLGEEFHHSSFYPMGASTIRTIHHRAEPAPTRDWDRVRIYHTLAQWLGDGTLRTDGLLTHTFPYDKAADAFDIVDRHPEEIIKVALTF